MVREMERETNSIYMCTGSNSLNSSSKSFIKIVYFTKIKKYKMLR